MEYKQNGEFIRCEWRPDIYTDTGADYSLPDYNGDVRKILFTSADVRPSGSFENSDSVDFSGIVVYNMVYSDSENKINSVSFTSDYDFSVKCDGQSNVGSSADISVSNYSMRLLGPRKISAKATLASRVALAKVENQQLGGTAFDDGALPEVECVRVDVASVGMSETLEREYAEELIRLDGEGADDVNIVCSDAECVIESVSAEDGGVSLKGNMRIYALVKCGDEPMFLAEKSLKIDESLVFENMKRGGKISPAVTVSSVRCTVSSDENGCSVVANVIADLSAKTYGNERVELTTDAYRRDRETQNNYGDYRYLEICTLIAEKEDFNESVDREGLEVDNLREVICLSAEAKVESAGVEDDVARMVGEIRYNGIACGVDETGNLSYHPFKISLPFVKNVNLNCQNYEKIRLTPSVVCVSAGATVDENKVYLSCLSHFEVLVCEERCVKVLTESNVVGDVEIQDAGAKITVYYPEESETLFDIAKKFHTTVERISLDNSVSIATSAGGETPSSPKRLLIF